MEKTTEKQLAQELGELLTFRNDPQDVKESMNLLLDLATDPLMHKQDDSYLTPEFMNGIDILRRIVQTIENPKS